MYFPRLSLLLVLLASSVAHTSRGASLPTVERTIQSYAYGQRSYTCLAIDGGFVPLILPPDAQLDKENGLTINWPKDRSVATIRAATAEETALYEAMDKPEGLKLWRMHLAAVVKGDSDQEVVRDFQPGFLEFNHWRCGAMTLEHSFAGVRSCILLLLWRTRDGSTLTVTLRSSHAGYEAHSQAIFGLIGGAMLLSE